jgi:SagB-type dehydrogenase family enzyme
VRAASISGGDGPSSGEGSGLSAEEVVIAYHERTKHHYRRQAASLGYMDWATQPDPFRRYAGAALVLLPRSAAHDAPPFWQLYAPDGGPPAPLSIRSLSLFFRYALSLTAWKRLGDKTWALRANPSSGNLHPTEGYALLPPLAGVHERPGVYHYAPKEHGLERRADLDSPLWADIGGAFPEGSFLVGLSSIPWREAWKYGERAFRYCQHDVGHALGTLRFAAARLGWRAHLLERVGGDVIARLLGLDREADRGDAEREHPELLALVTPLPWEDEGRYALSAEPLSRRVAASPWFGTANVLSPEHAVDWPVIEEVARATVSPGIAAREESQGLPVEEDLFAAPVVSGAFDADRVVLGRRSAVHMDGATSLPAETFFRMLARLVPTRDRRSVPWDVLPWRPRIHLGLFVHRVDGLTPGLYALVRDPDRLEAIRGAMLPDFQWVRPAVCPRGLPLYLLEAGDCRALAASVSCGQDIAGDGAFSLGMIADYTASLMTYGAGFYRNLFWEAGLVGQVLYLEAEEAGVRATGIGCYFDDPAGDAFGISSRDWQSFYHFTVGGPVEDTRLTTLPAYAAEEMADPR